MSAMKLIYAFSIVLVTAFSCFAQPCVDRAKQVKPVLAEEAARTYAANLAVAGEAYTKNPDVAEELIWYGRRMAYTGEYKESIKIFTAGIKKFPNDARIYRHRGHRYITLRCFDAAIRDLEAAARLINGKPDEVEPDGMPNERNIPTSTLQSNIWYHLGLAYYLKSDLKNAESAYAEAQKVSKNSDMLVATVYWRYMTLMRMGRQDDARKLIDPLDGEIKVIENDDYLKLIRLNRGEMKAEEILSAVPDDGGTLGSASLGYGIGNYFIYNGDREKGVAMFQKILAGNQWASFGYIAAETELGRKPGK
jgi:hypothetical protein